MNLLPFSNMKSLCSTEKPLLQFSKVDLWCQKVVLCLVHRQMPKLLTLDVHTKFHVTPLEACSDPTFFMENVSDTECKLMRDHQYYAQVQGQLGVTGAKWCDFIVYTGKGIYIERIPFDATYWQNLRTELLQYYFENFLKFAAADFQNSDEGNRNST